MNCFYGASDYFLKIFFLKIDILEYYIDLSNLSNLGKLLLPHTENCVWKPSRYSQKSFVVRCFWCTNLETVKNYVFFSTASYSTKSCVITQIHHKLVRFSFTKSLRVPHHIALITNFNDFSPVSPIFSR